MNVVASMLRRRLAAELTRLNTVANAQHDPDSELHVDLRRSGIYLALSHLTEVEHELKKGMKRL